mmetsp:Transcript_72270/g.217213  ORF Transcript_72270/g.217213 Transcript_72270/m.217213 type:complete len:214 (-) Transcript_72270:485-1126(-)
MPPSTQPPAGSRTAPARLALRCSSAWYMDIAMRFAPRAALHAPHTAAVSCATGRTTAAPPIEVRSAPASTTELRLPAPNSLLVSARSIGTPDMRRTRVSAAASIMEPRPLAPCDGRPPPPPKSDVRPDAPNMLARDSPSVERRTFARPLEPSAHDARVGSEPSGPLKKKPTRPPLLFLRPPAPGCSPAAPSAAARCSASHSSMASSSDSLLSL